MLTFFTVVRILRNFPTTEQESSTIHLLENVDNASMEILLRSGVLANLANTLQTIVLLVTMDSSSSKCSTMVSPSLSALFPQDTPPKLTLNWMVRLVTTLLDLLETQVTRRTLVSNVTETEILVPSATVHLLLLQIADNHTVT